MRTLTIDKWRNDPSISVIVAATFPTYRKHRVNIDLSGSVTLHDLNWSGGTRSEYKACTKIGKDAAAPDLNSPAPWDNKFEGKTIDIPLGFVVVRGGHFCGKQSTLTIYVNPNDAPKWFEQARHEVPA